MSNKKSALLSEAASLKTLNMRQVGEVLGVSYASIRHLWPELLASGLRAFKVGREWRVRVKSLEKYMEDQEAAA